MEPGLGDGRRHAEEPSTVGGRVARLWDYLLALLRLRLRQAQGDARSAARRMVMGIVFGAAAVILLLLMIPLLVTVLILALATVMPAWLAAAVVLAVLLAVVAGLLVMARARLRWPGISLVQDLRADWEAIRQKVGEGR
jgi:hypothetical protein